MNTYVILLQLAGAVALLLFAARMVRTGMERAQRGRLNRFLGAVGRNRLRGAGVGLAMAVMLQSATAVAMVTAGFVTSGTLGVGSGLAIMLGADLGSALVVQVLSLDIPWLQPLLLAVGCLLFFKGKQRAPRQAGRVVVGIGMLLLSLQLIGAATEPLRQSPFIPAIAGYLGEDLITAMLAGALGTWRMHSSVASILLIGTSVARGVLPLEAGLALVLGANIGGGLIAFGLTRAHGADVRRVTAGNVIFRTASALALTILIVVHPTTPLDSVNPARVVLLFHLLFNAMLVLCCLPLIGPTAGLLGRLIPTVNPLAPGFGRDPMGSTCLDPNVMAFPKLALASARRELLRMAELVELMLQPLIELYQTGDREKIRQARLLEAAVDRAQGDIKSYLAKIDYGSGGLEDARIGQELSTVAVNLEYVGDAIAKTLLHLAEVRRDRNIAFSPEGWRELNELHQQVMANLKLALNVLVSQDVEAARLLVQQKDSLRTAIDASYRQHFERLRLGGAASVGSSNIHLETLRTLKSINSHFATIGHPILMQSGELLGSRLRDAR